MVPLELGKATVFLTLVLLAGLANAAAPTISSVADSPDPVGPGRAVTFTVALSDLGGGTAKIYICKEGSAQEGCDAWCSSTDLNTEVTRACTTAALTTADAGAKNYNAIACSDSQPALCSSATAGSFTVDATPPSPSLSDVNNDTSAPFWARTSQSFAARITIEESGFECRISDTNWDVGEAYSSGKGTVCAAGSNSTEVLCPMGAKTGQTTTPSYKSYYNCKDVVGNATGGIDFNHGVDYTAPDGNISADANGDDVTVTYSGTDAHSGVAKFEVKADSGNYIDKGTAQSHVFADQPNGDHNYFVIITDAAGNQSVKSVSRSVNVDSGAVGQPTVTSGTHPNADWNSNNSPVFIWQAVSGAPRYRFALNNSPDTVPDANNETAETRKTFSNISDGEYYFHLRACTSANPPVCGSTAHYRIRIDTAAPAPVAALNGFGQSNASIYLSWDAPSDASGIKEYYVYRSVNQKVGNRDFLPSDAGVKKFTAATANFTDNDGLTRGIAYYYRVQAVDNAGNNGSMSAVKKVLNAPTSCSLVLESNLPAYARAGKLTVKINASGGALANATLRLKLPGKDYEKFLDNGSGAEITKEIEVPEGSSGTASIRVEGKDESGNSCEKTFEFGVDTAKPGIQIISPPSGSKASGAITISATASDEGSGIATVIAFLGTEKIGELEKRGSGYELQWDSSPKTNGEYTLEVKAEDKAGNSASKQASIEVQNEGPANEFVRKEFSYEAENLAELLKNAGVRKELI